MDNHKKLIALTKEMFPIDAHNKATTQSLISLLCEEVGETAGAVRSFWGRAYRDDIVTGDVESVKGEIGDCYVILGRLADLFGLEPEECLEAAITKLEGRLQKKRAKEKESDGRSN